jgi:hypothetical protein
MAIRTQAAAARLCEQELAEQKPVRQKPDLSPSVNTPGKIRGVSQEPAWELLDEAARDANTQLLRLLLGEPSDGADADLHRVVHSQ